LLFSTRVCTLNIKNAAKEKLEIGKVQDFGSEFLARFSPPQAAKCVRTTLRIAHIGVSLAKKIRRISLIFFVDKSDS